MTCGKGHDPTYTRLLLPVLLGAAVALVLLVVLGGVGVVLTCLSPTLSRRRKAAQCVGLVVLVLLLPVLVLLVPVRPRSCWQNRGAGQQLVGCGLEQCVYADPNNDALVIKALPVPGSWPTEYQVLSSCGLVASKGDGCKSGMRMHCAANTCPLFAYFMRRSHGWIIMQNWKHIQELQQTNDPVGRFFPTVHALDSDRMLVTVDRVPHDFDQAVNADQQLAELNTHLKRLDILIVDVQPVNLHTDGAGHIQVIDPHLLGPKTWAVLNSQWCQKIWPFNTERRFRGHSQLVPAWTVNTLLGHPERTV